jgi:hypothetical protein
VPLPPQRPGSRPGAPPTPEDAISARHASEALADECGQVEEELEALKARYEQFFLGLERREPARIREELKRRVARLKDSFTRNTGLKFRLQSLHARFISYERMWLRGAREREAGTYRRDVFKARLHRTKLEQAAAEAGAKKAEAAPSPASPAPARPAAAAAPAPTPTPTPTPTSTPTSTSTPPPASYGAGSDAQLRALYDAYVAAKKKCNEDVSRLTYDAVARSVQKQVPELISRFKAKSVEFRVEVKEGKAILKAVPRV